jgi:DeoR family suf operon transcriptional repressor
VTVTQQSSHPRPIGLKGPRAELVLALKGGPGLAARALIERLGLSPNAVRHHLKELEASGLITYDRQAGAVGAPSHRYHLTPAGEALFPRRYEETVARLLDHVVEHEGREAAVRVLEIKYRELASRLRASLVVATPEERLHAVTRALEVEGYMPELRPNGSALPMLVEHNCPMQQVAEKFPELCEAEARFLAEVLEANVTRSAHIPSGCGACEYRIETQEGSRVTSHQSREGAGTAPLATRDS